MRRHDFGYFVHEGVVNLFSHGFMSFAAVGITVACLLVMGTFSLVAYNVNEQLRQLESENEILAFVDDTLTEAQGRSLQSAVEAVPNVRSVRFITREEACETFEKKYEGKYALGDLDPEILRDRFAIKVIDLGADYYLTKPFGVMEFVSCVKAVLRRSRPKTAQALLRSGTLTLDPAEHIVTADGARVELTYKEFELLRLFLSHPGMAFTRDQLMEKVWDVDYCGETRTVDMHIRTLRQKLGENGEHIETVRGVGYRWEAEKN